MIKITKTAEEQILNYFNGKEITPIRVFLNNNVKPSLALEPDDLHENDIKFQPTKDLIMIAEKEFIEKIGDINIDFNGMGFNLTSKTKPIYNFY